MFDGKAFGQEIVAATKAHIDKTIAPLLARIETLTAEVAALKAMPAPKDGKDADPEQVARIIRGDIDILRASVDAIKPARDGKDADPAAVAEIIARDVTARVEQVRTDVAGLRDEIEQTIAAEVTKRFAELPKIPNLSDVVAAIPVPQNGKDVDPALVASLVKGEAERILAGWERPQDGKSVTAEELVPLIEDRVVRAVSAIPVPKDGRDGIGIASAMIDRAGNLIVTATDGTTKELGRVVGADGRDGLNGKDGAEGRDGLAGERGVDGINGKDGLPGRDGKDAEPITKDQIINAIRSTDAISVAVQQYLEANPPAAGKDGRDGVDGKDGTPGINGKDGTPGINGKDGTPGINGKDGANGADGAPGMNGKDGADGLNGKDGRDAIDVKDLLVMEGGDLVATFSDGRSKVLGPFRGKDGAAGKDADLEAIGQMIRDAVAKHTPTIVEQDEFVSDDLAESVSLAVKKMAEMPVATLMPVAERKTVQQPSQPVINVAAPVVTVEAPHVHNHMNMPKRGKEKTTVTDWDENGRIKAFEKTEIE